MLSQDLQRTQCPMFLRLNDVEPIEIFRVNTDMYNGDYNIGDLPDLPIDDPVLQTARLKTNKISIFDDILSTMVYDEQIQMALFKQKDLSVFSGPL